MVLKVCDAPLSHRLTIWIADPRLNKSTSKCLLTLVLGNKPVRCIQKCVCLFVSSPTPSVPALQSAGPFLTPHTTHPPADLRSEVLQDRSTVDSSRGTNPSVARGASLQMSVDAAHGKLQPGSLGARHCLSLGLPTVLSGFASSLTGGPWSQRRGWRGAGAEGWCVAGAEVHGGRRQSSGGDRRCPLPNDLNGPHAPDCTLKSG